MSLTVAKNFNTTIQRFKAGDTIPDDADLSPHTVESLKARGFIAAPKAADKFVPKPASAASAE